MYLFVIFFNVCLRESLLYRQKSQGLKYNFGSPRRSQRGSHEYNSDFVGLILHHFATSETTPPHFATVGTKMHLKHNYWDLGVEEYLALS
jgi:hypothetical protein